MIVYNYDADLEVSDTCVRSSLLSWVELYFWGPIYKISYDISYDYQKFIVRPTYDGDLQRAKIFLRNIVSQYKNTVSDDLTILQVNRT